MMRLLHTSDWHLGRTFHGGSLLDDQDAQWGECSTPSWMERTFGSAVKRGRGSFVPSSAAS